MSLLRVQSSLPGPFFLEKTHIAINQNAIDKAMPRNEAMNQSGANREAIRQLRRHLLTSALTDLFSQVRNICFNSRKTNEGGRGQRIFQDVLGAETAV